MSVEAEFLVSEKDGVGLPIFIGQDVLDFEKLVYLRKNLQDEGLVFESTERLTPEFYFKWLNFGHPHSLRMLIEKAAKKNMDNEVFLQRYGEFLFGVDRDFGWYPKVVVAD